MAAFPIRRAAFAVVTLFAVLTLVFVVVRILPGDPTQLNSRRPSSREAIEVLRARLGLDQPIVLQYLSFLANALRGVISGRPWSPASRYSPRCSTFCHGQLTHPVSLASWRSVRRPARRLGGRTAQPLRRLSRARRFACGGFPFPPLSLPSSSCSFSRSNCIGFQ